MYYYCGYFAKQCLFISHVRHLTATVDVYHSATNAWSTAKLSELRSSVAASSVGNVALFAGGQILGSKLSSLALRLFFYFFSLNHK